MNHQNYATYQDKIKDQKEATKERAQANQGQDGSIPDPFSFFTQAVQGAQQEFQMTVAQQLSTIIQSIDDSMTQLQAIQGQLGPLLEQAQAGLTAQAQQALVQEEMGQEQFN